MRELPSGDHTTFEVWLTSARSRSAPPSAGMSIRRAPSVVLRTKSNGPAVRRPREAIVRVWACRQAQGRGSRFQELHEDIEIVLLVAVPGERHLLAVRGETRRLHDALISGEGHQDR